MSPKRKNTSQLEPADPRHPWDVGEIPKQLPWSEQTHRLLTAVEKPENAMILFGKQKDEV